MPIDPLKDLERLRKRYNISIQDEAEDDKLFEKYVYKNPQPYFNYKKCCNIDRTLIRGNLKPKLKTGIEKKKDAVIAIFDEIKHNDDTLQRLADELKILKKCNKDLYRLQIRDF